MHRSIYRLVPLQPVFWLMFICLILLGLGLQAPNARAYQNEEITPSSTLELSATLTVEVAQSTFTFMPDVTLSTEAVATETSIPSITPSSIAPTPQPLPVLPGNYAPDEVVVRFRKSVTSDLVLQCLSSANAASLSSIEEIDVWVVQVLIGQVAESIAAIQACPMVRYAEPNYMAAMTDTIPNDPNWSIQYGLTNIRAPQGWDHSTGSSAVTIAIVDSGVDLTHADLAGKIVPGYDFVNNDAIAQDDNGHGTHVAGIAAASGNNGIGVAGVSWGARIMPVKVLNAGGGGSFSDVAAGIIWATDNGAQVINLSLGGSSSSAVLQDAVNYAYGKGVVLIAAAGNTGSGVILYPARYPHVIAVGAVDNTNAHSSFSNFGAELDLVAPGTLIYSTVIGGYDYKSGTSMAAPYVAGLAAILRGYPGGSTPDAIEFEMESTALDLGAANWDGLYGYGLIQLDRAIQLVYVPPIPTSTSTASPVPTPKVQPAFSLSSNFYRNPSASGFGNGSVLASTMTLTPTQTEQISSLSVESTGTLIPTNMNIQVIQDETEADLYALNEPKKGPDPFFSSLGQPFLGLLLILLGLWLFYMVSRGRERRLVGKRNKYL